MIRPDLVTLYKYMRVTDHVLTSLSTGKFWFAKPPTFNDPFDCALNVADDALEESVQHALHRAMNEPDYVPGTIDPSSPATPDEILAFEEFRTGIATQFAEMGIFCLCEACDDLLMWCHYADSHRGLCVGFARAEDNPLGDDASPVRYQRDYPRLSIADFDPKAHPDSIDHIWLTKAASWSYEREWRLLRTHGNYAYSIFSPISKIVFGARITDADRLRVQRALASLSPCPEYFQARKSGTSFEVVIEPAGTMPAAS
jgi:hypothetical protein